MNINNRCHLYIGLGEVGLQTIIQTKKMFINTYGEIPPFIDFLGISPQYSSRITKGRSICEYIDTDDTMVLRNYMNPEEYISVFSERDRKKLSWIPQSIQNCSGFYMNDAYILYRFGGRYEFIMHRDKISLRISQKIKDILRKNNATSSNVTVHVFFYTGCRFGAGMMIDLGYLLQELGLHNTQLHVMRGYDNINQHIQYTNAMTYATLCDLDYMNSLELDNNVTFHYLDRDYTATTRPYLQVFISDHHANNIYDVAKKQSLILLSRYQKSISWESIEDAQNGGEFGVGNKKAWCNGSNACEIIYTGGDIYKLKAAINIIDRMFNTCTDADIIANAWIDSAEVHIRENKGQDHVTDFICSKEPKYPLVISNYRDFIYEVNSNIAINKINSEDIAQKTSELVERVRTELRNLLITNINKEGGVALAKNILEELKIQVGLCLGEMKEEKEYWVAKKPSLKTNLETTVEDLKEYAGKLLATRSGKEQRAADVAEAVRQYNICLIDIQRHDAAITIYNTILVMLGESENRLDEIEKILKAVKQDIQLDIAKLQNGLTSEGSIFQINLAEEDAKSISVKSDDILITEFISTLSGDLKVYGLTEYSAREIKNMILNYTSTLKGANRSITDVIHNMSYTDIRALTKKCIDSFKKSQYIDWEGHTPHYLPLDIFIICADDPHIIKEHFIYKIEQHINLRNKIIICKYTYSVPIYAIKNTTGKDNHILRDLDNGVHHFDNNVFEKMKSEKWNIFPKQSNNDELN